MNQPIVEALPLPSDQDASGRSFDQNEIEALEAVIRSGTLTSTKGTYVKDLEASFASKLGARHAYGCTSGTTAIHAALAAIDPEPGDEIVTTSITDMGALTPILYQAAIPVFADVDPRTLNVTAETIEAVLSEKTRAIIVTHLFGNPCEMDAILELARARDLPVIEDAAQALLAKHDGRYAGTLGTIGCFSLQQGKHITTGEGGLVVTDDDELARRIFLFINKAWGYGDEKPDHYFLALNGRMTELQGAVALEQLSKLEEVVQTRIERAAELTALLSDVPGIAVPTIAPSAVHSYWKYCPMVDSAIVEGGALGLAQRLRERGIYTAPRYIQKPAFRCQVIAEQRTFGNSRFPFNLARPAAVDYREEQYPGTFQGLEQVLVVPWNERYTTEHVRYIGRAVQECAGALVEVTS